QAAYITRSVADAVFANHVLPARHGGGAAVQDGGLDGVRLAAVKPVVVGQVGEAIGTRGVGAVAYRAVGGEQTTAHFQGLLVLGHFGHRHGGVLGEQRAVLLVGLGHFLF